MVRRKFANEQERREGARERWRRWASKKPASREKAKAAYNKRKPDIGRAARRRWMAKNKKRMLAYGREWCARNPDKVAAKRARRREVDRTNAAIWAKKNAAKLRAKEAKRRADILRATPPWADHAKIAAVYTEADRLTRETGIPHDVDHEYPLRGRDGSCGLHVHYNLRVLTAAANRSKGNRSPV